MASLTHDPRPAVRSGAGALDYPSDSWRGPALEPIPSLGTRALPKRHVATRGRIGHGSSPAEHQPRPRATTPAAPDFGWRSWPLTTRWSCSSATRRRQAVPEGVDEGRNVGVLRLQVVVADAKPLAQFDPAATIDKALDRPARDRCWRSASTGAARSAGRIPALRGASESYRSAGHGREFLPQVRLELIALPST